MSTRRKPIKPEKVKNALDYYDGSLKQEAKERYSYLSDYVKKLDQAKKDELLDKTKTTKSIDLLTCEEQELGGALFKALKKLEYSKNVDLTDVWPKYHYLIEVFKHEQKFEKEKEVAMELKERKIPSSPIKHILDVLKTLNVDSRKLKEAKKQYDMIMSHGLSSYPEFQALKERYKKTFVEPQHITATHRKIAPDLSEVLQLAWGRQIDFSQEAIKELYFMLETYYRVKEKSHSMPASDVASSGDFHPPSSSKSLYLSTENINQVFEECSKKYKKELIENAEKELKQLKTYVRKFSSREEMVFISHGEKNEWYEQCLHARTDNLDSIPCSGRPLFTLLQTAINDKTPNSDRATSEYCSLLHLEMLFNKMENHDQKSENRPRMGNVTPSVHFPSVPMNVKDIIQTMEKYFASDFYKDALEEFGKLQHIEEKIAQDENLRSRKVAWKERSRGGSKTYVDDKTPSRPLHAVLLRAQKEGIKGSELALKEYGSMLHSEVLYESIDALSLEIRHKADLEPCWNISNQATSSSEVYQGIEGSVLESKEFALQEQIDRLQEQMKIRDSEIEGLKARLSQVESMLYNYPEKADLSDINRQTKVRERLEKDAHGLL